MTPRTGLVAILIALSTSFSLVTLPEAIMANNQEVLAPGRCCHTFPEHQLNGKGDQWRTRLSISMGVQYGLKFGSLWLSHVFFKY